MYEARFRFIRLGSLVDGRFPDLNFIILIRFHHFIVQIGFGEGEKDTGGKFLRRQADAASRHSLQPHGPETEADGRHEEQKYGVQKPKGKISILLPERHQRFRLDESERNGEEDTGKPAGFLGLVVYGGGMLHGCIEIPLRCLQQRSRISSCRSGIPRFYRQGPSEKGSACKVNAMGYIGHA